MNIDADYDHPIHSSQSVARMNTHWSNDIKMGPRTKRGDDRFAGRTDLERTRKYRDEDHELHSHDRYGMIFDVPDSHNHRRSLRSRSFDRARKRDHRSRSPRDRHGDGFRERDRDSGRDRRRRSRDRSDYDYGRRR